MAGQQAVVKRLFLSLRDRFRPVHVIRGNVPGLHVLQGVKLYRTVRIGEKRFIGSGDAVARPIDYVFDILPDGALQGKRVLDLGTSGGAVCFEAVQRGCHEAVGVETAGWRIRGAKAIKRLARVDKARFLQEDFFAFLSGRKEQFDVVFALNVLQHLANPLPLLRRMCRACREYLVLEIPGNMGVDRYGEYNPELRAVEGARPARTLEDLVAMLAVHGFTPVSDRPSHPDTHFFLGDESHRSVHLFTRERRLKSRSERLAEMEMYRDARIASFTRARGDEFNIDLRSSISDGFIHRVSASFSREWHDGDVNFVIAGPRAAGKSHHYDRLGAAHHPPYNPKIFKLPNADGRHGLRRHLHPRTGDGRKFAQVLLSTIDDEYAHCTRADFIRALRGKRVACVLLNVGFDDHFERLYEREGQGEAQSSPDCDVSLRFDCARVAAELKESGIHYRIVSLVD